MTVMNILLPLSLEKIKKFNSAEQLREEVKSQADGEVTATSTIEQPAINLTSDKSGSEGVGAGAQQIVESDVNVPFPAADDTASDSYEPSVAVQSSESSSNESKISGIQSSKLAKQISLHNISKYGTAC